MSSHHDGEPSPTLAARLEREAGVRASDCYQCGKCAAGCPLADEMDPPPSQLLRMLQLELPAYEERVLGSQAIWMCVGCETCATRCPKQVSLRRAMDFLREESLARGKVHPDASDIVAFHRAFLDSIESHGRVYELGMVADYKLRTGHLFQDIGVAPAMVAKGKLGLLPHGVRDKGAIGELFARAKKGDHGGRS